LAVEDFDLALLLFDLLALGDFFAFELLPCEAGFFAAEDAAACSFGAFFSAAKAALGTNSARARGRTTWKSFMGFLCWARVRGAELAADRGDLRHFLGVSPGVPVSSDILFAPTSAKRTEKDFSAAVHFGR